MKNTRKSLMVFLVVLSALTAAPQITSAADIPAVLSEMPSEAMVVVACRSLSALSTKVDLFAHQMGFMTAEQSLNMEQIIGVQTGLINQINGAGSIGLCVINLMNAKKTVIAYLPARDGQAAIEATGASAVNGTTNIFKHPNGPFMISSGKYLIMAGNAEVLSSLETLAKGIKLSAKDQELFQKFDVAGIVNLTAVTPLARQMIVGALASKQEIQQHPSLVQIITMAADRLAELQQVSFGGMLGQNGMQFKFDMTTQPGSKLANFLSSHPTMDISSLNVLPGQNAILSEVVSFNSDHMQGICDVVLDAIAADTTLADKVKPEDIQELKAILPQIMSIKGCMAMYPGGGAGPDGPGTPGAMGGMQMVNICKFENVDQAMKSYDKMCSLVTRISTQIGFPINMSYKKGVGNVEGVSIDEMSFDLSEAPLPDDAKMGLAMAYGGKPGLTYQLAPMGNDTLVIGVGQGSVNQGINLLKNSTASLAQDQSLLATARNLPSQANVYLFIDAGKYIQWICGMMQSQMQAMMQAQSQQGQEQPPMNPMMGMMGMMGGMFGNVKGTVGVSSTLAEGGASTEVFIPNELIKSVADVINMFKGMMGPQGPGAQPGQQPSSTF